MSNNAGTASPYPATRQFATDDPLAEIGDRLSRYGRQAIRWTVAGVLGRIGAMKFTACEVGAVEGLVASSPFTNWFYDVVSVQGVSNMIGVIKVATAVLIIADLRLRGAAILGAIATFVVTLSFLFTAPGWEASPGGLPALSVVPGQFIIKDTVLLAAAVWLLGDALKGARGPA